MDNTMGKYRASANLAAFWLLIFITAEYFIYSINVTLKIIAFLLALVHSLLCYIYSDRINQQRKQDGIKKQWWVKTLIIIFLTLTTIFALGHIPFTVLPPWLRGIVLAGNHVLLFRLPYFSLKKRKPKEAPEDV